MARRVLLARRSTPGAHPRPAGDDPGGGRHPGAKPIRVKPVTERGAGRLLGAQIVGDEGAAKRIDVLAMAMWHQTTVDGLLNTDLGYAAPFSPLWDPVLIAARKARQRVGSERQNVR